MPNVLNAIWHYMSKILPCAPGPVPVSGSRDQHHSAIKQLRARLATRGSKEYMSIGTPLSEALSVSIQCTPDHRDHSTKVPKSHHEVDYYHWPSWCPICKRPLDVFVHDGDGGEFSGQPGETLQHNQIIPPVQMQPERLARCEGNNAYAAALWGNSPRCVLGALVLGHRLRVTSSAEYDRVLLHTDDVPETARHSLAKLWKLKPVKHVDASDRLFSGGKSGNRFAGTFNKLHVLDLCEYSKVLLLDLDLVVLKCLDGLFSLKAPAAMQRGQSNIKIKHGDRLDGRRFFRDDGDSDGWCWGQGGGINAGVMLLQPNHELYQRVMREVEQEMHPEHIPGSGPEQDYLSRLYAPFWSHISVEYNFQLHQVLFSLEHVLESLKYWGEEALREKWLPPRLKLDVEHIYVIHFSGTLKLWDRDFSSAQTGETDDQFADRLLRNCSGRSHWRWIERASHDEDYRRFNVDLVRHPVLGHGNSTFAITADAVRNQGTHGINLDASIARATSLAKAATRKAVVQWRLHLDDLLDAHPKDLGSCSELLEKLGKATQPRYCEFWPMQHVEVFWEQDNLWYPASVIHRHADGSLDVEFLTEGWWGVTAKISPAYVRRQ